MVTITLWFLTSIHGPEAMAGGFPIAWRTLIILALSGSGSDGNLIVQVLPSCIYWTETPFLGCPAAELVTTAYQTVQPMKLNKYPVYCNNYIPGRQLNKRQSNKDGNLISITARTRIYIHRPNHWSAPWKIPHDGTLYLQNQGSAVGTNRQFYSVSLQWALYV